MKSTFARIICRMLVASMIVLPLQAGAGVIGTDQAIDAAQAQAARVSVAGFIARAEVAGQLQAFGISSQAASDRVAALTDAEVAALAGRIDEQPAGGVSGILVVLVVMFLFWRFLMSDQAQAESAKSAPKPAPEKK